MFIVVFTCKHLKGTTKKLLKAKKDEYVILLSSIEELEARSPLDEKAKQYGATKMIVFMHRGCPEYETEGRMLRSIVEAKEKKSPITVKIVVAETTKRGICFHDLNFINGNILASNPIVQIKKDGEMIFSR
ncbi:MAG: hypothetical protein WC998_06615 [Candidatus Paceibacterota bacterium]|jgi:hypothetical protein